MLSGYEHLGVNTILLEGILPKDPIDEAAMHTDRLGWPRSVDLWIRTGEFISSLVGNGVGIGYTRGKTISSIRFGCSTFSE